MADIICDCSGRQSQSSMAILRRATETDYPSVDFRWSLVLSSSYDLMRVVRASRISSSVVACSILRHCSIWQFSSSHKSHMASPCHSPSSPAAIWPASMRLASRCFQEFSLKREYENLTATIRGPAPLCFKHLVTWSFSNSLAEVRCDTARAG